MLFNLLEATSGEGTTNGGFGSWVFLIAIIVIFVVYFVFSARSRKKQQAEIEEKMSKLKNGDKIKTIGMIIAEIVEVNEDGTYLVMTGSLDCYSYMLIDKQAIYQVVEPSTNEQPAVEEAPFEEAAEEAQPAEEATEAKTEEPSAAQTEDVAVQTEETTEQ